MIAGKKIVAVLPAYKAELTLERTLADIPKDTVDQVILVDDASTDGTVELACRKGLTTFVHECNLGYGANQKTCYKEALAAGADVVVMLHPDYQYDPRLVPAIAGMVATGVYDVALGSRIAGSDPREGGMPLYKYISNRFLTATQNLLLGTRLSEFHTGYRAFSRRVLTELPLLANSNDFVFDNQMLVQAVAQGFRIGEISCPTRYFAEASSINLKRSIIYGLGVLKSSLDFRLFRWGLAKPGFLVAGERMRLHAPNGASGPSYRQVGESQEAGA